jgi:DNA-binding IclR family transcriptional regulator
MSEHRPLPDVILSEEELTLLAHFHEHAETYNDTSLFYTVDLVGELGWDGKALNRALSYLAAWGLVEASDNGQEITDLHFTGVGENYMRHVDARAEAEKLLERGKRLTTATVKGLAAAARDALLKIAGELLAQYATGKR